MAASHQADGFLFVPGVHLYLTETQALTRSTPVLMVEDQNLCTRRTYHQQKLALLLSAMRNHRNDLEQSGSEVHYFSLSNNQTIAQAIGEMARRLQTRTFSTYKVSDRRLRRLLSTVAADQDLHWIELDNPGFIATSDSPLEKRMEAFYRKQRQSQNILLDSSGKPTGGQWSFDAENRNKLPARQAVPAEPLVTHNQVTKATINEVAETFKDHPGDAHALWLPSDRASAREWLQRFVTERLIGFGTYEDALSQRSELLFHSALSPLLNIGLLTPREVIDAALAQNNVPLNDLEGFVRQVLGWREFIHLSYEADNWRPQLENKRNHTRGFTSHWYIGTTDIPPLDQAIRTMIKRGWNHHIERLMVMANMMNLCEIHPQQVYEYFMTHHLDAYDWVMRPNIEGMGITSSNSAFATKPYICGSNYILKMSDHQKGTWCDVMDGLYWRFVEHNLDELQNNARTGMTVRALHRLAPERKQRIFQSAENFLARCTLAQ